MARSLQRLLGAATTPVLVGIALTLSAPVTRAEAPDAAPLTYTAPAGCPDDLSLRAGVIAYLGEDPFAGDGRWRARVAIDRQDDGFRGVFFLFSGPQPVGERRLPVQASCQAVVDALEFAIAVAISPGLGEPPPVAPVVVAPPLGQPVVAPPAAAAPTRFIPSEWLGPPPARPATATGPRHASAVVVGVNVNHGHLPRTASGPVLRLTHDALPWLQLGVAAALLSSDELASDEYHSTTGSGWQLTAEACARRWLATACAVAGGTSTTTRVAHYDLFPGADFREYTETEDVRASPLLGAVARLRLPLAGRFALDGGVGVLWRFALQRPDPHVDWTTSHAAVTAEFALVVQL